MKPWIRRTLIGVFGSFALLGGLAAWAGHGGGYCWRGGMHGHDATEIKARLIDHASRRLDLDAAQQQRLGALADTLQAQRQALLAGAEHPRAELQQLIAGPSFDRTQAGALLQSKLAAVQLKSPEVINAFGDFYDSLRAEQQAQLREFMSRGRRGHRD